MNKQTPHLSYKDAGVDIDAGNQLVDRIKTVAKATHGPQVLGGLGGFAALYQPDLNHYQQPVLVSATDGVGTKLRLALELGQHDTLGIDLVAMCANDLIVCGAKPLFFLDYFATGQLNVDVAAAVIRGIGNGCQQAEMALVGGETAEMPGLYHGGDYDLAGFCVGMVDRSQILDGTDVQAGDVLIGLASSGPHSNGYSLIRKIIEVSQADLSAPFNDKTLGEVLLEPTKIYVKSILQLLSQHPVHAMAHITGGGLPENLPRVLPADCRAIIQRNAWQRPEIFNWLQQHGNVADDEMLRTFNCGIGMVLCVPQNAVDAILQQLAASGETAMIIGEITARETAQDAITFVA